MEELESTFDIILERTAENYGHAVRSVHAKAHGGLEGELTTQRDLPAPPPTSAPASRVARITSRALRLPNEQT